MKSVLTRLLAIAVSRQFADISVRIFATLRPYRGRLVLVGLLSVFVVVLDLFSAAAVAALVLAMNGEVSISLPNLGAIGNPLHGLSPKEATLLSIGGIVGFQLLREVVLFANELISKRLGVDVEVHLKSEISRAILSAPFERVAAAKRNDLIVYGVNFAPAVAGFATELVQLGSIGVIIVFYAMSAFVVEPFAFLGAGGVMLVLIVVTNRLVLQQQRLGAEQRDIQIIYHDQLQDAVHGLRDITIAGRQSTFAAMGEKLLGTLWRVRQRSVLLMSAITPIQRSIALGLCGLGVALLVIFSDAEAPLARLQGLLVVIFLLLRMYGPVARLNALRSSLMMRLDWTAILLDFLDQDRGANHTHDKATGAHPSPHADKSGVGDIVFDHVSYRYQGADVAAVEDLSFKIPAGSTVAIVGPSGAGKSTVIDLLTKLREPAVGEIRVGDKSLAELDDAEWRGRIAAIHQHGHIFYGTIAENIAMFRDDIPMADIEEAAARANMLDLVRGTPQGFETRLGGPDTPLSGGQRQRLQIARALLVKPALLILDEATSAQDAIAEDELLRTLRREFADTTIVTIAHRFSAIREAEHIIVLQDGRVAECGDWKTLSQGEGVFHRLLELQSLDSIQNESDALKPTTGISENKGFNPLYQHDNAK